MFYTCENIYLRYCRPHSVFSVYLLSYVNFLYTEHGFTLKRLCKTSVPILFRSSSSTALIICTRTPRYASENRESSIHFQVPFSSCFISRRPLHQEILCSAFSISDVLVISLGGANYCMNRTEGTNFNTNFSSKTTSFGSALGTSGVCRDIDVPSSTKPFCGCTATPLIDSQTRIFLMSELAPKPMTEEEKISKVSKSRM